MGRDKTQHPWEPIQWGLPGYCAGQQDEPGLCRVFKMTILTGIGLASRKRRRSLITGQVIRSEC